LEIENQKTEVINTKIFRSFPFSISKLINAGSEFKSKGEKQLSQGKYIGDKWGGKYLRAPDIYFVLMNKLNDKAIKLSEICEILPGCYSGINDFFYIDKNNRDEFKIEKKYLTPLIRSAKSLDSLKISNDSEYFVLEIDQLEKSNLGPNLTEYINWGETQVTRKRQKTSAGIPWPKTESVKTRKYWYSIPKNNLRKTNLFMQYVASSRFYCPYSDIPLVSDRSFHRIFPYDKAMTKGLSLILNSTFQCFLVMLFGRSNLGQGALKFEASDARKLISINPKLIPDFDENILNELGKRNIESVFIESGIDPKSEVPIKDQHPQPLPDRKVVDDIVFNVIGLNDEERREVYRSLCQLVWNRVNKAKSV